MKKIVLISLIFCVSISLIAQSTAPKIKKGIRSHQAINKTTVAVEPFKTTPSTAAQQPTIPEYRDPQAVSVVSIGSSANAYGYGSGGGQRSIVWYNEDVNVLTNFHRMGGDLDPGGYSGDLGYDISTDGGISWTNMVETFVATEPSGVYYSDAARYPQAVIANPEGNNDPAQAHLAFFAAVLDGSNVAGGADWGGYGYGIHKIGSPANVDTTKNLRPSMGEFHQYIPSGMAYARNSNIIIVADINYNEAPEYYNTLIINRGVWSEETQDFVYEEGLLDAPIVDQDVIFRPACVRVAFGPDGETGYIVMLSNNGENELAMEGEKSYYPIVWKTEDAGESWSDSRNIQLDGPDGIPAILEYLTDAEIDSLFVDPDPERDEIPYTTAFDFDLVVDVNGNPHIAVGLSVQGSDDYSIISGNPWYAIFDIFSPDGGDQWNAVELARPFIMRGEYGAGGDDSYSEDSRVCAATNWDGTKVFFSWLDTDPEVNPEENTSPDVWVRGFDPIANLLTADFMGEDAPTNVTFGSAAMWQSYFGTMSRYTIDNDGSYVLPITYEDVTLGDPGAPVQYYYIQDFSYTDEDFSIQVGPVPLVANFDASATALDLLYNNTIDFTDLSSGGAISWTWEFEGGDPATSNEQNPSVVYGEVGEYDVSLTISNGSDEVTKTMEDYINVYNSVGVNEIFANAIAMYPNPATDNLIIEFPECEGNMEISICDNTGRVLASHSTGSKQLILDLSKYAKGVYVLRFNSYGQSAVKKLLVK